MQEPLKKGLILYTCWAVTQAEAERKRLLKRLGEARAAATQPHQPRWFTLHPEVRLSGCASQSPPLQNTVTPGLAL